MARGFSGKQLSQLLAGNPDAEAIMQALKPTPENNKDALVRLRKDGKLVHTGCGDLELHDVVPFSVRNLWESVACLSAKIGLGSDQVPAALLAYSKECGYPKHNLDFEQSSKTIGSLQTEY